MTRVRLRELLTKNGKSVYWLANETGIHNNNLRSIVKNQTKAIKFETIELICKDVELYSQRII